MNPVLEYHEYDVLYSESWINDNKHRSVLHRENGPAFTSWFQNGELDIMAWWINGERHRVDGPAVITHQYDGKIQKCYWHLNGFSMHIDDWCRETGNDVLLYRIMHL